MCGTQHRHRLHVLRHREQVQACHRHQLPAELAEPTHIAGLKHGMIWTEGATGLGQLPATGAFYCCIGPKHAGGMYTEARAFGVTGDALESEPDCVYQPELLRDPNEPAVV